MENGDGRLNRVQNSNPSNVRGFLFPYIDPLQGIVPLYMKKNFWEKMTPHYMVHRYSPSHYDFIPTISDKLCCLIDFGYNYH